MMGAALGGMGFFVTSVFASSDVSGLQADRAPFTARYSQAGSWQNSWWPVPGATSFQTSITVGGASRTVLYLKPTTARFSSPPAIVLLHYRGGTPAAMANLTVIGNLVAEYGIWAIVPASDSTGWSSNPNSQNPGTSDVTYLNTVIDGAVAGYHLDPKKIYMAGYSDGAYMTQLYACQQPGKIAAAATVDSEMIGYVANGCLRQPALPVLMFAGTNDPVVLYGGAYGQMSVPATAAFWAQRNGCSASPIVTNLPDKNPTDGTTVQLSSYTGCTGNASVQLYTVNGGGHTWPGTPYATYGLGKTTQDINATETLWSFFSNYSR
jgi:polyhydroxybutyrate depolymerase